MDRYKRNFMDEMYDIICKIENLKPEPEICNVSCPPLGCPQGPCPGICYSKGILLDPCCVSKMPCSSSSFRPSHRCMSRCLKNNAYGAVCLPYCGSSSMNINRGNPHNHNGSCFKPHDQLGFQQAFHSSSHDFTSTTYPRCTGSVQCL